MEQVEKAYQKQHLFQNTKAKGACALLLGRAPSGTGMWCLRNDSRDRALTLGTLFLCCWVVVRVVGSVGCLRRLGEIVGCLAGVWLGRDLAIGWALGRTNGRTRHAGLKKVAAKNQRWYKDVGLGFKTPAEAINGTYIGMSSFPPFPSLNPSINL